MSIKALKDSIDGIDIYILDQLLKERYQFGAKILDAGCGRGRNLKWFYNADFEIYGVDTNESNIEYCQEIYSKQRGNFIKSSVEETPFNATYFDHVICNAVLHFAKDKTHFNNMFTELLRILKPEGSLFIRIASNFGIEDQVKEIGNGVYKLPDGSTRFLLTQHMLDELLKTNTVSLLENVKTTIVHNKRSMTTLVFKRNNI